METASVEGFEIRVTGPSPDGGGGMDWRMTGMAAAAVLFVAAVGLAAGRRLGRGFRRWMAARRMAWTASETYAYRRLRRTIAHRDLSALFPALDAWAARLADPDPRRDPLVKAALNGIGDACFGKTAQSDAAAPWAALGAAARKARRASRRTASGPILPSLNPTRPPYGT